MASTKQIPTRILVLSDTHSALPDPVSRPDLRFSHELPEADVAIHCGDLTSCGKLHEHERAIALLKSLPAPIKIVIPGNHDMTLDSVYLQQNRYLHGWNRPHNVSDAQDAVALYNSHEAKEAGILYIVEGLHSFSLPNGAKLTLYASAYTPEFCNWSFAYPRSLDRFNVAKEDEPENPVPSFITGNVTHEPQSSRVTVMVTHGPPRGILDHTIHGESVGCDHLLTAVSRCRPLLHCFGHIHEAWGAEIRLWADEAKTGAALVALEDQSKLNPGTSIVPISHPTESLEVDAPRADDGFQNVSVIDARGVEHGKQTVFVNASIMDVRYVPRQWPWLVRINLPEA